MRWWVSLALAWWQCWWDALCYVCLLCWLLLCLYLDSVSLSSLSFLGLCGPGSVFYILFPIGCTWLSCLCPGREDTLPPSVEFAPLPSLFSVFSTLPLPCILSITWFLSLEPSSFPSHLAVWLEKARAPWLPCFIILNIPICPVTHTCTFLVFFPVFSFFLSRQLTLSSQLFLWHFKHDPPSLLLQNNRCDVPWSFSPLTRVIFSRPLYFTPSFSLLCSKCSR